MNNTPDLQKFSRHRLRGELLPPDLAILFANREALYERTGLTFSAEPDWEPWADTSYLTKADLADPGIAANVKAIAAVTKHISFVAATEDNEYFGYWHGPTARSAANSPIVYLDNEGQFHLCSGQSFADAILEHYADDPDDFADWKSWLTGLGINIPYESIDAMLGPEDEETPDLLHGKIYHEMLGQ